MSVLIPAVFVLSAFFLTAWVIFGGLITVTDDQTESLRVANQLYAERVRTNISITSTTSRSSGDCLASYTATALNESRSVSLANLPNMDVITVYTTTGSEVSNRLTHSSDWSVSSISGDTTDTVWDPGETATIAFSVSPAAQTATKGRLALGVAGGVSDSAYFDAGYNGSCAIYWHNDPTPPTGDTNSQATLPMDTAVPTATTLFNYDVERDPCVGLSILEGGSGPGETDSTLHQVWRTSALTSQMVISGDVTVDFWSATRRGQGSCVIQLNRSAEATIFLRDRNDSGSYSEIGSGTLSEADWQGGTSDYVQKTLTISDINYTVASGHQLEAEVTVPSTQAPALGLWFAYDTTAYQTVLTVP